MPIKISVVGHNSSRLGIGYDTLSADKLRAFARELLEKRFTSKPIQIEEVISGMALGWDQAVAMAAVDLGLRFVAAIPFDGQESGWSHEAVVTYHKILSKACEVVQICEGGYDPIKLIARDEYMIDRSTILMHLWNGEKNGSAWQAVQYATKKMKPVIGVWHDWMRWGLPRDDGI